MGEKQVMMPAAMSEYAPGVLPRRNGTQPMRRAKTRMVTAGRLLAVLDAGTEMLNTAEPAR